MYEAFYGLRARPFSILPDPAFLYLSNGHRAAAAMLHYALEERSGFTVVTGAIGTGKTTLLRHMIARIGPHVAVGMISNTHPSLGAMSRRVLSAFGVATASCDAVAALEALQAFLAERSRLGRRALLVIDEAQNLAPDMLEELRMLSNLNTETELLQVILAGQPALRATLRRSELEQFAQRVVVEYHLQPLGRGETHRYVAHRLGVAGGGARELFDTAALDVVFDYSGGVPRLVNVLCENALVYGFACSSERIDAALVHEVATDRQRHSVLPLAKQGAAP
jgi:type II secretory pathway predicted ATPase ExeA